MHWLRTLVEPIPSENKRLLAERWRELPDELRTPAQAVGRHLVHCGYVLGPSYCSFGCTHCYLPKNANKAPLPSLDEMKRQIDANRRLLGHAGNLQITGGDVVDAYLRAGEPEQLVSLVRYAVDVGLVPMVMTHGQGFLDHPDLLEELVRDAGLRKIALHVDLTQAGRPGFPRRDLTSEADLHPLREAFVDLVLRVRRRTGKSLKAAHTVTVTADNLDSVGEILRWMLAEPRHLEAFSMLSLQPEADVGRTLRPGMANRHRTGPDEPRRATPEDSWKEVCRALGRDDLADGNLHFGDPACSRMTSLGVLYGAAGAAPRLLDALPGDERSLELRGRVAKVFGGVGGRGADRLDAALRRISLIVRHPLVLVDLARYAHHALGQQVGQQKVGWGELMRGAVTGRLRSLNIVQHNFMSDEEVRAGGEEAERRLAACSFRGAVEREDGWHAVPMCAVNSGEREQIYARAIEGSLQPVEQIAHAPAAVGAADDQAGAVVELEAGL